MPQPPTDGTPGKLADPLPRPGLMTSRDIWVV
ncbi:hypothetical protein ACVWZX_002331 [Deinococcus sp. UYEF24]